MHTFRTLSITLTLLLFLGLSSTEALAKRPSHGDGTTDGSTQTTLSDRSVRNLAKAYLSEFQAVDPNITLRDLTKYIYSLNVTSITEAESALQSYLSSLQNTAINHEPLISGSPTVSVNEGDAYLFTPSASDADGDALSFSILNKPVWASFDATSGSLSGVPDSNAAGTYDNVQISVTDGNLIASLPAFTITVNDVPVTPPTDPEPVLTAGAPTLLSANISGTAIVLAWTQENVIPEGGYDTFIDGVDTNSQYRTTSNTVSISGLDLTQTHCFVVEARYTDTAAFYPSNQMCSVALESPNQAPVISGLPESSTTVGVNYSFTPVSSDPDGDELIFSSSNLPGWISLDSATGTLSGTPGELDIGSYPNITLSVSDGNATVSLAPFTLLVEAAPIGQSASTTLSWSAPTTRADGTALALSEIDGYRIYMGDSESSLLLVMDINDSTLTTYTLTDLTTGSYFFTVTAYDMDGVESGYSNIISKPAL